MKITRFGLPGLWIIALVITVPVALLTGLVAGWSVIKQGRPFIIPGAMLYGAQLALEHIWKPLLKATFEKSA